MFPKTRFDSMSKELTCSASEVLRMVSPSKTASEDRRVLAHVTGLALQQDVVGHNQLVQLGIGEHNPPSYQTLLGACMAVTVLQPTRPDDRERRVK